MPSRLFPRLLPPQRIRTYLVLFAMALVLPVTGLALYALNELVSVEEEATEQRIVQVVQGLAAEVDRELNRAMVTLETLATSGAIETGDLAAFHDQARRAINPDIAGVLLIDTALQQLVNTRAQFGVSLPPTSDPETANRVLATKRRQVSDLFLGVVSRQHVVNLEVPVLQNNQVRYILIMALDAVRLAKLLEAQQPADEWTILIADRKGAIIARSDRHEEFVGKRLSPELFALKQSAKSVIRLSGGSGESQLGAAARSLVADWTIAATVPTADAEGSRSQGRFFAILLIATALGLGAALAYVFGALMTQPLTAATAAATDVGRGKLVDYHVSPLAEANALTLALSETSKELRRRQDHSEFLMRELAHRAKNQLAVVLGMATQTARQVTSTDEFIYQFGQRIQGLGRSQDLVVQRGWEGAKLADLVRAQLNLFGVEHRADIQGPDVFVDANAVQNIGFALHELATNASKHGALSSEAGSVKVAWHRSSDGRLHVYWSERGVTGAEKPARKGFGHMVVTTLVPRALQGTAHLDFRDDGIEWHLDIPDVFVLSQPPSRSKEMT